MNTAFSVTRKRMFANILSIVVMLALAFPVTGNVYAQEPVLPVGWHDGVEGVVNAAGCGAFGWTVDPDDPDRDLQVQILADGSPVATTTADLLREDVGACTAGTCGFGVNLWGLISPGVEYLISAQAYDEETSTWVDLSGTPKAVTCWGYPEGFHDGNEGIVDPNSCTASGWVADPDNRDRDVRVQILADENFVVETTANLLREDVGACTEGTCGYSVSLWGLILPDIEHQILALAFDEETGEWWNLESTPKSLTCFTPSPYFTVFPEWEFFDGLDWPDGANVTITVKDKPECESSAESWGGFFNGNFGDGCDLEIGDEVTFTDGTITRTHTVQNLAVTNVDVLTNAVGGTADPGAVVDVWPHETGQQLQTTGTDGYWQVDFTGLFDLVPGTCGRSQILVGENATAVDWCAPKPWLIAFPENEAVEAWEWPVGTTVTLTIDNAPENFVQSGTSEVTTWGDPRTYVRFDFWEDYNLQIGDVVTLTDGTITRTHIVQNLSVTDVNAETDILSGTANPGTVVTLWPHGYDQIATIQTTAGDNGAWYGDFASVGFNLVPGIGGRSEAGDEAGNWTAVDWNVPMLGWQQINDSGFGDPQNVSITALEIFHGQLIAGATNWDTGGQVWRLGGDGQWAEVNENGFGSGSANPAVIDLAVFQGQLYAGSGWNNEAPGQIWRSPDGTNWQPVTTNGFGNDENIAITNFVVYKNMLYAGTGSINGSVQIWRSLTGNSGSWTQVAPDGLGFTGNVTGFAVYKGVLYAAIEPPSGVGAPLQVWRSINGSDWTTVTVDGFSDPNNTSTGGFAQFGGYLYLGTQNEDTGAQLWRTADGMYWEQVIGNGFGDLNNIKIEALLLYGDFFYATTKNIGMGLQLWRSADGSNWEQVIANGFGDGANFATLWNSATVQYQGNLVIGTWNYTEGGEVWMFTP